MVGRKDLPLCLSALSLSFARSKYETAYAVIRDLRCPETLTIAFRR